MHCGVCEGPIKREPTTMDVLRKSEESLPHGRVCAHTRLLYLYACKLVSSLLCSCDFDPFGAEIVGGIV